MKEADKLFKIHEQIKEDIINDFKIDSINEINFWIEDEYGKIDESPERSIDIALSEYAPGRMIVVNKKSYISGGLYDHYTKYDSEYAYKAVEPWLKKYMDNTCSDILI
ncbi:hypothetical protein [Clostridium amazonitimonense]|uniref:hypothetical protein n=1 Tax=Clostridium amazonitimonense TaxID=1499689 RepID=UPI00050992E1|nr:hypothetical protein [Clostridium amazonitimonense]